MEDREKTLRYELTIVYALTLAVWPHFTAQGHGVVISTASVSGHVETHPVRSSPHGATKAGMMAFARMLAAEGAPCNIRSASISPGLIETPTVERFFRVTAREREIGAALINKVPSGRAGRPEYIANVAVFLASDDASYINGTHVRVDGGLAGVSYR
jgi:NAD(P)-dependent dehydrogenase (short-subunit alcohol dehydrogenase family)